jgi:hypothetical protein
MIGMLLIERNSQARHEGLLYILLVVLEAEETDRSCFCDGAASSFIFDSRA